MTDKERREVAARLRKAIGLTEFAEVLGFNWTDDSDWGWKDVSSLVADLIEPSCDRDAERTCRDTDCDTESITCSECGEITRYTLFWVDVDGGKTVKGHRPRFCSNCGRRVLYDSDDYI